LFSIISFISCFASLISFSVILFIDGFDASFAAFSPDTLPKIKHFDRELEPSLFAPLIDVQATD